MIGSQLCNTYVVLCETDEPFKAFSGTLSYWYIDGTSFHAAAMRTLVTLWNAIEMVPVCASCSWSSCSIALLSSSRHVSHVAERLTSYTHEYPERRSGSAGP